MGETHPAPIPWEKVYIFVSSTFNDMHADRDYLVKRVFPELQDWCERHKLRLVEIDLRWGVTEQDAAHNKNVVKVCLSRIDDCRPFFLCFLGQRRGWVPKEEDVSAATFEAFPDLRSVVGASSVTEMEVLHALISPLHHSLPRDTAKPAEYYEPAKYAFFYLRDPSYLGQLPADPPMLRETYTNEAVEDEGERAEHDRELKKWREDIASGSRPSHSYEAKWDPNAATPELTLPLQCPSTEPAHIERWQRQWQKAGMTAPGLDLEDNPVEAGKAREFNSRMSSGRLVDFECEGARLSKIIIKELQEAIAARYPAHSEVGREDELQREIDQQEQFLFTGSEGFIERDGDFAELDDYAESDSNGLFVVTAPGGMGKSTLLANWVDRYRRRIEGRTDHSIHFRFIGQSDGTTTIYSMLRLLLSEIKEVAHKLDQEIPLEPTELRNEWPALLEAIGAHGKTVIVIDALNQLESGLSDVSWLPRQLPHNIKLIVSFKRGDPAAEQLYERLSEGGQVELVEVNPFGGLDDRRRLVRAYLSQYLKELDAAHLETLINLHGAENPLYLKVVLSELRVFGAYSNLAAKIHSDFGDTPVSAFVRVLERLENDPAYSPIDPKQAVSLLFGLLAHARRGLSVDELTSLLIRALGLDDTEEGREAAGDTVNLFLRQVRSSLARREGRYDFLFESFKIAAQQCYVVKGNTETISRRSYREWHQCLASYFASLPTWQEAAPSFEAARQPARRKVAELPHHLIQAQQWHSVEETLCDLDFIEAKCAAGMAVDLVADYHLALAAMHANAGVQEGQSAESATDRQASLELLARLIQREVPILVRDPGVVPSHLHNMLFLREGGSRSAGPWLDYARTYLEKRSWLRLTNRPQLPMSDKALLHVLEHNVTIDAIAWSPKGILACAVTDGTIQLWDPESGRRLTSCADAASFLSWSPDGSRLASARTFPSWQTPSPEGVVVRLRDETGVLLRLFSGHTKEVTSFAWSADGSLLGYGSADGAVRVWNVASGDCKLLVKDLGYRPVPVFSPQGGSVAITHSWGEGIWDLATGQQRAQFVDHPGVGLLEWSTSGQLIATGGGDKAVRIWDGTTGALRAVVESPFASVEGLAWSPDSRLLAWAGARSICLWDPATKEAFSLGGQQGNIIALVWSLDSRWMASATSREVVVWDMKSRKRQCVLKAHGGHVLELAWSPDSRTLASSSGSTVCLWDPSLKASKGDPRGHRYPPQVVVWSPDSSLLASMSENEDHTVRIWNGNSGRPEAILMTSA